MNQSPQGNAMLEGFRRAVKIPHARALNLELVDVSPGEATVLLPYDQKLVGYPDRGILHGGVVTTVMDNAMGIAVFSALDPFVPLATLDLRLDYLKPAEPGLDVRASATCYKVTRHIAFVRGLAYHADKSDPIANGSASFMLQRPSPEDTAPEGE